MHTWLLLINDTELIIHDTKTDDKHCITTTVECLLKHVPIFEFGYSFHICLIFNCTITSFI